MPSPDVLALNPQLKQQGSLNSATANRRTRTTEADEQIALIEWRDLRLAREPRLRLLFHPPNGGLRDKATAGQMKALGQSPGVPDLLLPVGSRGYVGLAIELKTTSGVVSPEQAEWLDALRDNGWMATVQRGWLSAAAMLCWYLDRDDLRKELE